MAIPESQLSTWSHHGAQDSSKHTHEAIRRVLDAYQWPPGMTREFYLQGSYRNDTNIRGDSDVDVVLELKSTTNYDTSSLSQYEQELVAASLGPVTYDWNDFRRETLKALESGLGRGMVSQGNKSIKLKADPPRLAADVVVCMGHRQYTSRYAYVEGITFWALRDKRWIVNYPKEHYKNGAAKNSRTGDRYKRTVRMFKNARNHLESTGRISADLAPSYFVECLLYNAPDWAFQYGFQDTYCSIVNWMVQHNLDRLVCQNGQQWLFGPSPEQWSVADANGLANHLVSLWNDWRRPARMHSYEVEGRGTVAIALAIASILMIWLLHVVLAAIDFQPQWWLSVPSFAGCYSGLHWLFDRYVWRLGLLRKLKFIQLPDLNGEWVGKVESSYNQDGRAYSVSVVILQRWSKILVRLETERSRSRSITASLRTIDLLNPELSYQYMNEPRSNAPSTMGMHRGTAVLELIGSGLEGDYYTGRGRGEVGTIKLSRS